MTDQASVHGADACSQTTKTFMDNWHVYAMYSTYDRVHFFVRPQQ